jgi:hypothetical protein
MAKLSGGIPPLIEESDKLHHTLCIVFEQFDSHSKWRQEYFL